MMRFNFAFLLIVITSSFANAQNGKEFIINNQQRGADFSKTNYAANDSIFIPDDNTAFFLRIKGANENVPINIKGTKKRFTGTYLVSELYEDALRNWKGNERVIRNGHISFGLTVHKASDSTCIAFLKKLSAIRHSENESIVEYGAPVIKLSDNLITLTNPSDKTMHIDVIWFEGDDCRSAVSFASDYSAVSLPKGETITYTIDSRLLNKRLYIACTPMPVAYNTISLKTIAEATDSSLDIEVPLTIIPLY